MENTISTTHNAKFIARNIFVALLAINGVSQIIIGIFMLIDFPTAADKVLSITYSDDMQIIGIALGSNLLFGAVMIVLGVIWTLHNKQEGVILGAAFGVLAIFVGLLTFLVMDRTAGLTFDVLRGVLIVAAAAFATHNIEDSQID